MSTSPKVIFRMVAHNSERTIARAIESVLAQTYDNLELHVCIRASTDGTTRIADDYAAKDPRIRVIINKQAFEYDEGNDIKDYYREYDVVNDFVCFMDGDDEYKPDFLEKMVPFALDNNLDIAACGNDIVSVGTGEVIGARKTDSTFLIEGEGFCSLFPHYFTFMCTRWAKLFRLSLIDRLDRSRIYWVYLCDDTVETIEYFRNADRVGIYADTLYKWYYSGDSMSFKWDNRRIGSDGAVFDTAIRYLNDKAGRVTKENYGFLCQNYFHTLVFTLDALFNSDLTVSEILAALSEIFKNNHIRETAAFSSDAYDRQYKDAALSLAINWINDNEEEITSRSDLMNAQGIITALNMFVRN